MKCLFITYKCNIFICILIRVIFEEIKAVTEDPVFMLLRQIGGMVLGLYFQCHEF